MQEITRFTEEALGVLLEQEEDMKISMLDIQKYFLDLLQGEHVVGAGRVKSASSLKEKILRKSYHVRFENGRELIESLDDVIGVRVICLLHDEESHIWEKIKSAFSVSTEKDCSFYVNAERDIELERITLPVTQKNGHDIYKIHGRYFRKGEPYHFELQIKSLVHMLWGEIEHMLFYKNYEYIIDNGFYSSVMDAMYNNLMGIDSQLKNITQQMQGKNDEVLFGELKRMLAKILYDKVNPAIESLLGCRIDLRECYDSVIEVVLHKSYYFSYQVCLLNVQQVVRKINEIDITKLKTDIPYYQYRVKWNRDKRMKRIANIISDKSKNNIYYRLFVFLVGEMCSVQGAQDTIETVADYYLRIFRYEDDLEEEELDTQKGRFIIDATDGFLEEIIRQFDFYWLISHKSYIMDLVQIQLSMVRQVDIDEEDDITRAVILMKDILMLKTRIDMDMDISKSLLQEIYQMSDNEIWNMEEFRNQQFLAIIQNYDKDGNDSRKVIDQILSSGEVGAWQRKI